MTTHVIFSTRVTGIPQQQLFTLAETDRERKHTKSRDTVPGRSGKIYSKNFCNKRKVKSQNWVGDELRGAKEATRRGQEVGHARGAPGPPGAPLRLHLGLEFS